MRKVSLNRMTRKAQIWHLQLRNKLKNKNRKRKKKRVRLIRIRVLRWRKMIEIRKRSKCRQLTSKVIVKEYEIVE